jgi:hypothetical protein
MQPGHDEADLNKGRRDARAGALGFRDFSSLSPAKENRRQQGNPACCIPAADVSDAFQFADFAFKGSL